MKVRIFGLLALLVALACPTVPSAEASVAPLSAVSSFFAALDAGDQVAAAATFTPDAIATLVRGETYYGPERIARLQEQMGHPGGHHDIKGIPQLVELMEHPGRYHNIAQTDTVGNSVTVVVDIYDRGVRWGEDTIVFEVQDGKLHRMDEQAFRLLLR